jgi:hypothetical protein
LVILAVAQFIAVLCGSVGPLLIMSGNERQLRNVSAAAFVLCLVLNILLIPEFGALGAAISACVAIVFRNLLGTLQVYRHLHILPFFVKGKSRQAVSGDTGRGTRAARRRGNGMNRPCIAARQARAGLSPKLQRAWAAAEHGRLGGLVR